MTPKRAPRALRSLLAFPLVVAFAASTALPAIAGEKVEEALNELLTRHQKGANVAKDFQIDEQDANAFLRDGTERPLPDGIENPWIRFEDEIAVVGATVDLDKFRTSLPDSMMFQLLTGRVPVEVTAHLSAENGVGKLDLVKFLLSGIELPASLLASMAQSENASKFLPPGFKLGEPFPLPFELQSIRCRVGALTLTQGPAPTPPAK